MLGMPPLPDRKPYSTGISEHPGSVFHHIFKPKGFSKGHLQRNLSNLPPTRQGRLRHCFGNVSAVIQNAFSWGGWKRMGWRAFRWGGENVWLKTAFPGTVGTIGRGGGKRMVQRGGGENVPNFWSPEIKKRSHPEPRPIFNHCLHRTLFCHWVAVVRSQLSGCTSHSVLVCLVTLTFGGSGMRGSLIGAAQPKKHGKPPPSQNIWENSSPKPQNFGAVTPPPFSPPFGSVWQLQP